MSPGSTGITAWPRIGPESSSGVTSCTVQPCTAMPAASARAWVSRPGKSGRIEGWMLSIRPLQRGDEARRQHPHEAGEAEDLGAARARAAPASAASKAGAVAAERRGGRRRRSAARAPPPAPARRRRAGWRARGRPRPDAPGRPCRAPAPACSSRRPRSGSRRACRLTDGPSSGRPRPAPTRPIRRDRLAGRAQRPRRAPRPAPAPTTATMPMPQLKVFSISASAIPALAAQPGEDRRQLPGVEVDLGAEARRAGRAAGSRSARRR